MSTLLYGKIPAGLVTDAKTLMIPNHEHKWEDIDAHFSECFKCRTALFFDPLAGTDTVVPLSEEWWNFPRTHNARGELTVHAKQATKVRQHSRRKV